MAYTDATKVAAYLGRTLTGGQTTQATALAVSAAAWWDRVTGRSFVAGAITDELHHVSDAIADDEYGDLPTPGQLLYLNRRPVASIQAITVRDVTVGATETTLTSGTDYELLDAANGVVLLPGLGWGMYIKADYTPTATVPDDAALANTMLVAHWLTVALDTDRHDLKQYSVGGELQVTAALEQTEIPPGVLAIAATYRPLVFA